MAFTPNWLLAIKENKIEDNKIESQYQKDGSITFNVDDDDDFIALLCSLLREQIRQEENERKMKEQNGNEVFNINLIVIKNFIEKMKKANPSLYQGTIISFIMSQKNKS